MRRMKGNKPLVVIVKGNPKYIANRAIKNKADAFYNNVRSLLEQRGFRVTFDAGEEMTRPDVTAYAWVAHSKGEGRLRFAPDGVKTYALATKGVTEGKTNDEIGFDPEHYMLSEKDIHELRAL